MIDYIIIIIHHATISAGKQDSRPSYFLRVCTSLHKYIIQSNIVLIAGNSYIKFLHCSAVQLFGFKVDGSSRCSVYKIQTVNNIVLNIYCIKYSFLIVIHFPFSKFKFIIIRHSILNQYLSVNKLIIIHKQLSIYCTYNCRIGISHDISQIKLQSSLIVIKVRQWMNDNS